MKKLLCSLMLAGITCSGFAQTGYITTYAGTGVVGYSGDGGQAAAAKLSIPFGIAFDASGNLYFSDYEAQVIRKISSAGIITTIAGNGTPGYTGDGGPASSAEFDNPEGLAFDALGNLYIADADNNVVRMISTSGIITTVAGNGFAHGTGSGGYTGDGAPATTKELNRPSGVAIDGFGNLFIADTHNGLVRKVDNAGIITTAAGIPDTPGYAGDGGPATAAKLDGANSVAIDAAGNLFIADEGNYLIRKIDPSGIITTYAGNRSSGYNGDGGPATAATLSPVEAISTDAPGNLYLTQGNVVRKINAAGIITRVAGYDTTGTSGGFGGDLGPATAASLNTIAYAVANASGDLFIADGYNARIRMVSSRDPLLVQPVNSGNGNLLLLPNPNSGSFVVKGSLGSDKDEQLSLQVTDMLGRVVYKNDVVAQQGSVNTQITLGRSLPGGVYQLHLSHTGMPGATGICNFSFVLEK